MSDEVKLPPPPIPNPVVHPGARRAPVDEALAFLRANRDTHTRWAEYFEQNPSVEAEYVASGVWEGAADQRRIERQYNAAIAAFEALTRPTVVTDEVVGWQPIESAPKDGTSILAIWQWNEDDPNCGSVTHEVVRWCGWWDTMGFTQPEPTHWMPLPEPPRAAIAAMSSQEGE
jgi:hypothetical protein